MIRPDGIALKNYPGKSPGYIAVTMLKGRETSHGGDNSRIMFKGSQAARRRWLKGKITTNDRCGEQLFRRGEFDAKLCLQRARDTIDERSKVDLSLRKTLFRKNNLTPYGVALVRGHALTRVVNVRLHHYGLSVAPVHWLAYHSRASNAHGTPFLTVGLIVAPRKGMDSITDMMDGASNEMRISQGVSLSTFDSMDARTSMESLKGYALSLLEADFPVESVSRILDMSKGTITAWKAHLSRGSYTADEVATDTKIGRKRRVMGSVNTRLQRTFPAETENGEVIERAHPLKNSSQVDWGYGLLSVYRGTTTHYLSVPALADRSSHVKLVKSKPRKGGVV